ncbi:hypothetical protein [Oceanivirga miroungae]|uniref:Uncharacterized protein n=1 Tax=Oceanivirga miroungae TaxID=1130046 RepID=A0A6I8MFE9_9FUSO|nr:hypothetical protein [Oceanivirga miroungae]VWL85828.1 hypothetical protein OMES3154_01115 [Oceanivirga miroungae]
MEKKQNKILLRDKKILHKLVDFLLKIVDPVKSDFNPFISMINRIETDTFYLSMLKYIDTLSLLKKIFLIIERDKSEYFEYKYDVFNVISKLEEIYNLISENKDTKKQEKELKILEENLSEIIYEKNKDKKYFYIKVELDKTVPYYYLSRKIILLNLLKYGSTYNYTPRSLDDDVYSYLILDYKLDSDVDIDNLFKEMKKIDKAILNYSIYKIDSRKNLYNLNFYIRKDINNYSCLLIDKFKFLDRIHYENYYDTYVEAKNQRYLLESLFLVDNFEINLIAIKKISEMEVKIYLPNGLNENNIVDIKNSLKNILIDKNISEIIYTNVLDFKGLQMLEYLNKRYNIEYTYISGKE